MFNVVQAKIDAFKTHVSDLRHERFFKDRLSVGILVASLGLNLLNLAVMVLRLRPTDFPVPIHYSSLTGFDALGPWYYLYSVALFALAVTILNAFLAQQSFTRSRITSFFLLTGAFVVAMFSLIISLALSAVVTG